MKYRYASFITTPISHLARIGTVLTRLQPYFIRTVNRSPMFSPDQKKKMVDRYSQQIGDVMDGVGREGRRGPVSEVSLLDKEVFGQDDIAVEVKWEGLEDDVQYLSSLGLDMIEKLFLTRRIPEDMYYKYRRLFRYLPKLHSDTLLLWNKSRK